MAPSETQRYVLEHRKLVQVHMSNHRKTWTTQEERSPDHDSDTLRPIHVFVRVRPLLQRDLDFNAFSLVDTQSPCRIHVTHPTVRWQGGRIATKTYEADGVFSDTATNDSVYVGMEVPERLKRLMSGEEEELSILAYGQTGTGKTFTSTYIEERIAHNIFTNAANDSLITVIISIFELRGAAAYDLLSDPPLELVQISYTKDTTYQGLTMHQVSSEHELVKLIRNGKELRMTRSTSKNDTSSRSHSVITMKIVQQNPLYPTRNSVVTIVDLAGSERSSIVAANDPERVKESVNINRSLAALKDCIRARLSDDISHIPWRSDKLTMVLKSAFEKSRASNLPTKKLIVLACISPSVLDNEDTLNTLKYITPFQLSAAATLNATLDETDLNSTAPDDVRTYDHEKSLAYLKRNCPKLLPLLPFIFPSSSTLANTFLALSLSEFTQLCTSFDSTSLGVGPINAVRPHLSSYHAKLQSMLEKTIASSNTTSSSSSKTSAPSGSTRTRKAGSAVLNALNGIDFSSNETGPVQRLGKDGKTWKAVEALEKANKGT